MNNWLLFGYKLKLIEKSINNRREAFFTDLHFNKLKSDYY